MSSVGQAPSSSGSADAPAAERRERDAAAASRTCVRRWSWAEDSDESTSIMRSYASPSPRAAEEVRRSPDSR